MTAPTKDDLDAAIRHALFLAWDKGLNTGYDGEIPDLDFASECLLAIVAAHFQEREASLAATILRMKGGNDALAERVAELEEKMSGDGFQMIFEMRDKIAAQDSFNADLTKAALDGQRLLNDQIKAEKDLVVTKNIELAALREELEAAQSGNGFELLFSMKDRITELLSIADDQNKLVDELMERLKKEHGPCVEVENLHERQAHGLYVRIEELEAELAAAKAPKTVWMAEFQNTDEGNWYIIGHYWTKEAAEAAVRVCLGDRFDTALWHVSDQRVKDAQAPAPTARLIAAANLGLEGSTDISDMDPDEAVRMLLGEAPAQSPPEGGE